MTAKLVLVFLSTIALFLIASSPTRYHGDERFYSDAALLMVWNGDYLTPRYLDGQARFVKPPLFYWAQVVCFKVFGPGLLVARLPSLVAALGTALLVAWLHRSVYPGDRFPALSTLIMLSNFHFLSLAVRGTPDSLCLFFVLLSAICFFRAAFNRSSGPLLMLGGWASAGLATLTKGLVGLVGIGSAAILWLLQRQRKFRLSSVVGPTFYVGMVGLWVGMAISKEGWFVVEQLAHDQVTGKVGSELFLAPVRAVEYFLDALRFLLPWSAILAVAALTKKFSLRQIIDEKCLATWWLIGWILLVVTGFSLGDVFRGRYLIYAYPAFSVLIAHFWQRLDVNLSLAQQTIESRPFNLVAVCVCLLLGVISFFTLSTGWRLSIASWLLIAWLWHGRHYFARYGGIGAATWIAGMCFLTFASGEMFVRPALKTNLVTSLSRDIRLLLGRRERVELLTVEFDDHIAGAIRCYSGGQLWLRPVARPLYSPFLVDKPILTRGRFEVDELISRGWFGFECASGRPDLDLDMLLWRLGLRLKTPKRQEPQTWLLVSPGNAD